jgi:hypothetical protein
MHSASFFGRITITDQCWVFPIRRLLTMSDTTPEIAKSDDSPTDSYSTVKFDVGGRLYKVSRSLIEKFPSTMLARMISEIWQKDPEATLFIDHDSDRFRFCLDYMRADKVCLPLNISKEAFLDDLAFYGFEDVDPSKIHGGSSNMAAALHLSKCKEEHEEVLSTCRKNAQAAERAIKCEDVAYECFLRLSQGKSLAMFFSTEDSHLYYSAGVAVTHQVEFEDHLAKYGLALVTAASDGGVHHLTLKEKEDTANYMVPYGTILGHMQAIIRIFTDMFRLGTDRMCIYLRTEATSRDREFFDFMFVVLAPFVVFVFAVAIWIDEHHVEPDTKRRPFW